MWSDDPDVHKDVGINYEETTGLTTLVLRWLLRFTKQMQHWINNSSALLIRSLAMPRAGVAHAGDE
jgi:hypothetical protein